MAIRIEEQLTIEAPAERVWSYLLDPEEVVQCIPGAALLEKRDDRTFVGQVKVKVGPVTATYEGEARFTEIDRESRTVKLKGEGQERGGGGSASMTMNSSVLAVDGGSELRVEVELEVVGKLVQFGRGMIQEVSRQLFNQFGDCVRSTLAGPAAAPDGTTGPGPAPMADPDTTATATGPPTADESTPGGLGATAAPPPHQGGGEPVRILPLIFRAIRNRIARLFGRS